MNRILDLSENQRRQYIDAETVFLELRRARSEATEMRGAMFCLHVADEAIGHFLHYGPSTENRGDAHEMRASVACC